MVNEGPESNQFESKTDLIQFLRASTSGEEMTRKIKTMPLEEDVPPDFFLRSALLHN